MIKIVDVIKHKNAYGFQIFFVLDKLPDFRYERLEDGSLQAEDGGFAQRYVLDRDPVAKAFAGRQFKIPMKDGTEVDATGQWWDAAPKGDYVSVGANTVDELRRCYVFCAYSVRRDVYEAAMREIEPKTDYYHYEKRRL